MVLTELDLGHVELQSTTSRLQLQLSSRATFAPSTEDEIDALQARLTSSKTASDGQLWVVRGYDLRFVISLRIVDGVAEEERDALCEQFATCLGHAKVTSSQVSPVQDRY